jgi:integrase
MRTLTSQFVKAAPNAAEGKRDEHRDAEERGLALRVTSSGAKSWVLLYSLNGKKNRLTLGSYPSITLARARELAKAHKTKVAEGVDPIEAAKAEREEAERVRRETKTFGEIAARWVEDRRMAGKRSLKDDTGRLKNFVLPKWKDRAIGSITRAEVRELLQSVRVSVIEEAEELARRRKAEGGDPPAVANGVTSNRVASLIKTIFNYALDNEIIVVSPAQRVKNLVDEKPRKLQLLPEQVRAAWRIVCEIEDERFRDFQKLLWWSCARRSEVSEASWSEIDLEAKQWNIPRERTKNGVAWVVPLHDRAVEMLRARKAVANGRELVFSDERAKPINNPVYWHRKLVADKCGVNFRMHDLRSVSTSYLASWSVPAAVREMILNHVDQSIGGRHYNSYDFINERRAALDDWAAWIAGEPRACERAAERDELAARRQAKVA